MTIHSNYFEAAQSWDEQIYGRMRTSRNRAWLLAGFCAVLSILCLSALLVVLPLKEFAPYVITVDRQTGYLEVTKGLYQTDLAADQAITESNLVQYVTARESYNPAILQQNFDSVVLRSGQNALRDYQQLWSGQNPDNPSRVLGRKAFVDIRIKSVSFIADKTASVRFIREKTEGDTKTISHWNATLTFQYTEKPMRMVDRFQNPLGFQVTSYRLNEEILETNQ